MDRGCGIAGVDPADRHQRQGGQPANGLDALYADRLTGIGLGRGRGKRAMGDIVEMGGVGGRRLRRPVERQAEDRLVAEHGARRGGGQVALADVAADPGGRGNVDPIVDHQGHAMGLEQGLEGARLLQKVAGRRRLVTKLHQADAPRQRPADHVQNRPLAGDVGIGDQVERTIQRPVPAHWMRIPAIRAASSRVAR